MTRRTKMACSALMFMAAAPMTMYAHYFGADPGYTAAPGDNKTSCVSSGCHSGVVNSGGGNVKVLLPAGNTGTYVPGQAMQILVQVTDSTKIGMGFQLTARSGSGNTTQAGDFSTTDANTQVLCADSAGKVNGQACSKSFPIEYVDQTEAGYEASTKTSPRGAYTFSFDWTPPVAGSGTVTMYVAANCGPGDPPVSTPTNIYTSSITLVQAAGPTIANVTDAESARASFTSGQWVAVYGADLSNTSRQWVDADFKGGTAPGSPLPSVIDGVSATIGGLPASVFYVSPTQINVLSPSNLPLGTVPVVLTNNGAVTAAFNATVVQSSPSFFYYGAGGKIFPLAVHLDGTLIGDPSISGNLVAMAHPGEIIELFANGLAAAPGGVIVTPTTFTPAITVTAGSNSLSVLGAALLYAGEFQVNVQLPTTIAPGNYTLAMTVPNGSTSTAGLTVTLPVGP